MMSIPSSLFLALFVSSVSGQGQGGYLGKSICEGYAKCVKIEFSVISDPSVNCGGACDVKACMKRVLCDWKGYDKISHVCWNNANCASHSDMEPASALVARPLDSKVEEFEVDAEICATGKPGTYVHFAVKDASYVCDGMGKDVQFSPGVTGEEVKGKCYRWSTQYGSCSGNGNGPAGIKNVDATCAYAVQLPNICGGSSEDSTKSSPASGISGDSEGCCLETVFPTCTDVGSEHSGHLTANFPTADTSSMLAQLNAEGYGCTLPNDDCPVLVCQHHIPDEVITSFSGTTCPPVP